ncbi:DUF4276 family protein [Thiohalocapsa marina]|uniref:DUF4276 family protein n=1 Tax=Thiohalocapsa marina TaxID=424902 RepID=A0A5M8FT90_9GAMM|nr:DUF4276 family protein [Thiohalocapsa marina]KAA6186996.1 DUF4276 family protein [Thiohalocapsa marina]
MNDYAEVVVLVEGRTEKIFAEKILAPYLASQRVYLTPVILSKQGQKGGDVRFSRAKNDIGEHLKQRSDTWVSTLVDYYGIKPDWPGFAASKALTDHAQKAATMNQATMAEIARLFPDCQPKTRFIPYVSMHETEALYFSDPACLASNLGVRQQRIDAILNECGEPERINDRPETAPSKRLGQLANRFKKTTTGIAIAEQIGISRMRAACPIFDGWIAQISALAGGAHGQA